MSVKSQRIDSHSNNKNTKNCSIILKTRLPEMNKKLTAVQFDIDELHKKYQKIKQERLEIEKNQQILVNRVKYLLEEKKRSKIFNSNKSKENNKKPNTRLNITRSNFYNSILANKSGHKIYENMINTNLEPKIYYKNKNYFTEPKNFSVLKDNVLKQKIKVKQLNIMNESLVNRKLFNKDSKKTIKNPVCYTKKMSKLKNCDNEKKNDPVNEDDNQFIYYKKIITVNKK